MGLIRNISISLVASIAYLFSSFFLNIVPCQVAPNVPNPIYAWELCNMNPDKVFSFGVQKLYFGITFKLTEAYFLAILFVFVILLGVFTIISRKSKKIKDE